VTDSSSKREEHGPIANALFEKGKYKEALDRYLILAETGFVEAQLRVGWMYHTGHGVKVDLDQARRWYLRAAESNSLEAQFYLGTLYRTQKLYQEAMKLFEKCAERNYVPAIYQLGKMSELGEGVSVDKEKAQRYYKQAASMGHLMAERDIAVMMIRGHMGYSRVPQGLLMLVRVICSIFSLGLTNPNSDRIRW
jgi:TPR repeat protein